MPTEIEEILKALIDAEKERLNLLRTAPLKEGEGLHGVLLSDRIEHLCKNYDLITPFDPESVRPAGYDLCVGERYAIDGEQKSLGKAGALEIPPYQVAVIQTFETLNLPRFLIGRWNIRVKLAYDGLLWVGGAQVDPGFRGHLACPIYNLSQKPVSLRLGETLAMIDFVSTTPYKESVSKPFLWKTKKIVFQQYNTDLKSGVAEELKKIETQLSSEANKIRSDTTGSINGIQTRIDNFLTLIFTVIAVLFAGLGIVATKGANEASFVSSTVWIAVVALYFALRSYSLNRSDSARSRWRLEIGLGVLIVVSSIAFNIWQASVTASEVRKASEQAAQAIQEMNAQRENANQQIELLRQELAAMHRDLNVNATVTMPTKAESPSNARKH